MLSYTSMLSLLVAWLVMGLIIMLTAALVPGVEVKSFGAALWAGLLLGLFNVLEERDVQIRGFPVRLELDLCMVFSANPEDYTNRGRLVTPLKDRIGSVIRTHYPLTREIGVRITEENAWVDREGSIDVVVPGWIKEMVEEIARLARSSPHVNQQSGVSVRMSIANMENAISNAERRAAVLGKVALP